VSDQRLGSVRLVVSAAWVIGLLLLGKVVGLAKDVVVASRFGTTVEIDAFLVAFTIPTIIVEWFRGPIRSGFIPLFTESFEQKGEKESWRATGVFLGDLLAAMACIAVAAFILAPWIVSAVAPGFDAATRALTTTLVRIMLVSVALAPLGGVLSNLNHCYGNFAVPGITHAVRNGLLIAAAVFLTATLGVRSLACGVVAGSVAGIIIQWPMLWRHRADFRLGFDLRHPLFVGVLRLALPLFIGMAGAKLDDVIDRVFASGLAEGSISGLSYAMRLLDIPREILVVGFSTVLFPFFSRLIARGRTEDFSDRLIGSLRVVFFMLFPASVAIALLGEPFVRVVFERGAFDEQSVRFTVSALLLYTPTLWALGLTTAMVSGFVAMKNTKSPVIAGFARLGVKIALIYAFIGTFQHAGIALATSVSHVFKLCLFFIILPPVVRRGRYRGMFRSFGGTVLATAIMGGFLYYLGPVMLRAAAGDSVARRIASLAGPVLGGLAVYVGAAFFLARRELGETVKAVREGLGSVVSRAGKRPRKPVDE
jgi:putative peptidoglycan lipid II flippase